MTSAPSLFEVKDGVDSKLFNDCTIRIHEGNSCYFAQQTTFFMLRGNLVFANDFARLGIQNINRAIE